MARLLIAGCGYLGRRIGERAAGCGWLIHTLSRAPMRVPDGWVSLVGDLTDPVLPSRLPGDLTHVVFAASAAGADAAGARALYAFGPARLAEALPPGVRFVLVSSTGVYGEHRGGWVDEDTVPDPPASGNARWLLEGEERLRAARPDAVTARLSGLYGPERIRLIRAARSDEPVPRYGIPRYLNQVHRNDAADAILHLLRLDRPLPIYLVSDHHPAPRYEVVCWIARQLGLPLPPLTSISAGDPRGNKRCRNRRLLGTGFRFRYPTYREGYRSLLRPDSGSDV